MYYLRCFADGEKCPPYNPKNLEVEEVEEIVPAIPEGGDDPPTPHPEQICSAVDQIYPGGVCDNWQPPMVYSCCMYYLRCFAEGEKCPPYNPKNE